MALRKKLKLNSSLGELLWGQFIEFFPYYLGAFLSLWVTHYCQSFLPFLARDLGELVKNGQVEQAPLILYLGVAAGILIFRTLSRLYFFTPARILQKDLKTELMHLLEESHPSRYQQYSPGQLFQVMQNDFNQLRAFIGFAVLQIGNVVVAMMVLLPKMLTVDHTLMWAYLPLFLSVIGFSLIVMRFQRYQKENVQLLGDVQNLLIESYEGKKTIKNFHAENSFIELFRQRSWRELESFTRANLGPILAIPLVNLGVGISLVLGAYLIHRQNLPSSHLILFSGFVFLLKEPLMFLSWISSVCTRAYASWKNIKLLLRGLQTATDQEATQAQIQHHQLQWRAQATFWDGGLNFDFPQNKWSVIVGKTGHGKTSLLFKLADGLKSLPIKISMVGQNPYIFNDTLASNLFLGRDITAQDRLDALFLLDLFELKELAPLAPDLLVLQLGENGKGLSGGQAKRVCLVRSLLNNADVLIWDDPFSSVDALTEKQICMKLKSWPRLQQVTVVMSSHRLTTVRLCQHVVFIDKEEGLVEQGEVKFLLNQTSKTHEYFQKQVV